MATIRRNVNFNLSVYFVLVFVFILGLVKIAELVLFLSMRLSCSVFPDQEKLRVGDSTILEKFTFVAIVTYI